MSQPSRSSWFRGLATHLCCQRHRGPCPRRTFPWVSPPFPLRFSPQANTQQSDKAAVALCSKGSSGQGLRADRPLKKARTSPAPHPAGWVDLSVTRQGFLLHYLGRRLPLWGMMAVCYPSHRPFSLARP